PQNHVRIHAPLESVTRVALQIQIARRPANACRKKISGLEQNIFGRIGHTRFFATHHATNSNRTLLIGDNAIVWFERVSLSIEREKFLTVAREPYVDTALQFIGIERMRRLTQLQHHEIGNVDDVVDGANPDALNLHAQPLRARTHSHLLDLTQREEWTVA